MTRLPILACAAIALGGAASAQSAQKPISRADYIKTVDGRFNNMDANHDGFLSRAEMAAQAQRDLDLGKAKINQQLVASFNKLDTNHDGKLTLQEFMGAAPAIKLGETPDQIVQRLDSNHDGRISTAEFRDPEVAKFNRVDANHDGIATPQEVQAARK